MSEKVAGLSDQRAFDQPVAPAALTPAGVVKHLTGVERFWFSIDFAGADLPWPWPEDDQHGCFPLDSEDTLPGIVAAYQDECARGEGMTFRLRYAFCHMIEETARHCGHLDLLRERLDGQTGE